jgi:hypothetical protein
VTSHRHESGCGRRGDDRTAALGPGLPVVRLHDADSLTGFLPGVNRQEAETSTENLVLDSTPNPRGSARAPSPVEPKVHPSDVNDSDLRFAGPEPELPEVTVVTVRKI